MKHRGWRRLCKLGGTALRRATARLSDQAGQSLVEAVIALMIFLIAGTGMIDVLTSSTNAHGYAQATSLSEEAAQTAIEQIRDLNYTNIGLVDGNPAGTWVATKTAASLGFPNLGASIVTKIKYVGDGITGGYNQLTDYKQVTVSVVSSATGQQLAQAETFVAPPTQADQGNASQAAMVISVIDSINGLPVSGVPIELANGPSSPLNDVTDSTGSVTFAGLTYNPTSGSTEYYDIDPTYPSGYALDPNVTQASLAQNLSPGATGGGTLQVYQEMTFDVTITDGGSPYGGSASVLVTQSGSSKCTSSQSYTITGGSGTIPNQYPGCTYTLTPSATGLDGHAVTLNVQNDYPTSSSSGNLSPAFALTLSTPPSATSINLVGSSPTNASSVSWTTTFNEPVTGVSASNFSLAASNVSGASITSVTPVSPVGGYATTYTITASTGTGNSSAGSPGTLGLNLSTIAGITDSSGDSLTGTATGQVYTIQVVAPTVSNVSSTLADGSYTTGQLVPITVTFPEAVNVTGTPQLQLATAGSTNEQASYASGSGTSTLTFNYTVAAGDATQRPRLPGDELAGTERRHDHRQRRQQRKPHAPRAHRSRLALDEQEHRHRHDAAPRERDRAHRDEPDERGERLLDRHLQPSGHGRGNLELQPRPGDGHRRDDHGAERLGEQLHGHREHGQRQRLPRAQPLEHHRHPRQRRHRSHGHLHGSRLHDPEDRSDGHERDLDARQRLLHGRPARPDHGDVRRGRERHGHA